MAMWRVLHRFAHLAARYQGAATEAMVRPTLNLTKATLMEQQVQSAESLRSLVLNVCSITFHYLCVSLSSLFFLFIQGFSAFSYASVVTSSLVLSYIQAYG